MSYNTYDVNPMGWVALSFISCRNFVHVESIVPVATRCGGNFNTDSDGFEMLAEMRKGACEVNLRCLAPSFISCLDFICTEFAVPVATRCGEMLNTDSDGFEMLAKWATAHMSAFRVFGTQFCSIPRFHTHQVYYTRSVESTSLTRASWNACRSELQRIWCQFRVFGSQYYFVPANSCGEKFNTESDGFEMHAELS